MPLEPLNKEDELDEGFEGCREAILQRPKWGWSGMCHGRGATEVLGADAAHGVGPRGDTWPWTDEALEPGQLLAPSEPHQSYLTYPISEGWAWTCSLHLQDHEGGHSQQRGLNPCLNTISYWKLSAYTPRYSGGSSSASLSMMKSASG